ncbi:4-alpha-glucanotransferase [Caenispirillum salinarum]|uniref:4-alpha-glucanotransferase n=1 Tax=Caenispirillum salinarum TaxID=859058 RepID=UPI00384B5E44
MEYVDTLARLAEKAGIEPAYHDIFGNRHEADEADIRALLAALGVPASDTDEASRSLDDLERRDWGRLLPPATVLRTTGEQLATTLTHRRDRRDVVYSWVLIQEDGLEMTGVADPGDLATMDEAEIGGIAYERRSLPLPSHMAHGYHTLRLIDADGAVAAEGNVIVCPTACYTPHAALNGNRAWGVACQLYSVRSDIDWGMGDFSSLRTLAQGVAQNGGHVVGLNPLHSLFPANPLHISPYSPSSRLFLNPLYIDVQAVPEAADSMDAKALMADTAFRDRLDAARKAEDVDYAAVSALKHEILRVLHKHFRTLPADHPRVAAYQAFLDEGGYRLHRFAVFMTLHEHFDGTPWHQWPEEYLNPAGKPVLAFASEHMERVNYHLWLQFEADRQLAEAAGTLKDAAGGPTIGLYRDLAVGVDTEGADTWMDPGVYAVGARVGAPPDELAHGGQDWGMPPLNPLKLREMGYGPFIEMVRANMRHAGALRMDHAMALQHLYWIPPGVSAKQGTYVSYPMEDLLGILALESHRNCCMVIGEDLGTVPDGFRERMAQEDVLSYRLFYFERYDGGLFKRPEAYPDLAVATPTSHDLFTIVGHWRCWDIALRHDRNLVGPGTSREEEMEARAKDRALLVAALKDQGLVREDFPEDEHVPGDDLRELILGVHRFLARAPSRLMLVNLDDLAMEESQVNVPGTVDEYPNWQRRLTVSLERLVHSADFARTAEAVRAERHRAVKPGGG